VPARARLCLLTCAACPAAILTCLHCPRPTTVNTQNCLSYTKHATCSRHSLSPSLLLTRCPRPLPPPAGLPEEVAHTKQCLSAGYAVLALMSRDREYRARCFSTSGNPDLSEPARPPCPAPPRPACLPACKLGCRSSSLPVSASVTLATVTQTEPASHTPAPASGPCCLPAFVQTTSPLPRR
jgi:hypothetical protein